MKNTNDKTIRSAKSQAVGYYYNDNWHGLHHQFQCLDDAKRHAIANNMGIVCIFSCADNTPVCTVEGALYFA